MIFLFATINLSAQPLKDTLFITRNGEFPLNKHLFIYKTIHPSFPESVYNSAQDFKLLYPQKVFNEGVTNDYYWFIFTVKNNMQQDVTLYYQFNNPGINVIKLYKKIGSNFKFLGEAGDKLPFNSRIYKYYDIVFPFHLDQGEATTIITMLDNTGDNLDCMPQLFDTNTFKDKEERYYVVIGVITGIMLTAFILNIFLGITLKDRLHLLYSVYILAMLFEMYIMQGIDVQYLYPHHPAFSDVSKYLSPAVCLTLMAYVMQMFLKQTRGNSHFKIIVDALKYFIILLIPVWLIIHFGFPENRSLRGIYQQVFAITLSIQLFLFFLSAFEKYLQRYKPALFYLVAIVYLWYGAIQYVINIMGINVKELIEKQPNDLQIGIVAETLIVFLGIIYRYNFYKKEKEKLAFELQEEKLKTTREILNTQEREQKRIAADLHDELGGNLAAIKMTLQSFNLPEEQSETMNYLIDKASNNARHIAHNLMPPEFENISLKLILEKFYQRINTEGKINFNFYYSGKNSRFNKHEDLIIYRIIMELTNNIIKHSRATEATIQLIYHENLATLMAEDNGKGFSQETPAGMGLKNIRSRVNFLNGTINIDSRDGGTTITIQIPFKEMP